MRNSIALQRWRESASFELVGFDDRSFHGLKFVAPFDLCPWITIIIIIVVVVDILAIICWLTESSRRSVLAANVIESEMISWRNRQ